MTVKWERLPSVMAGGKGTFVTTLTPNGRFWVVWRRDKGKYLVGQEFRELAFTDTEAEGRKVVEKLVEE